MRTALFCFIAVVQLVSMRMDGLLAAGTQKKPVHQQPLPDRPIGKLSFWDTEAGLGIEASAQCVGAIPPAGWTHPWGALAARVLASAEYIPLPEWHFTFDKALPIYQPYLDVIQDNRTLPSVFRKQIKELPRPDRGFYLALNEGLRRSNQATLEMFEKSAEENKDVVYSHLRTDPNRYRGRIIAIKGRLVLIRREDPPRLIEDDSIRSIYTGWIIGPTKGAPPFTIVFTELPKDLAVSEKVDVEVSFFGYFLAHVRFPADRAQAGSRKDVISPYLVGKTVIPDVKGHDAKPPIDTAEETPYTYLMIIIAISSLGAVALLAAVLTIWFQRDDRKIRSKLAAVRDKHHPFTLDEHAGPETEADNSVMTDLNPVPAEGHKPNNGAAPPAV